MTKLRWDRVWDWDRVRDGRSNAELAEDRDQRWFDAEMAREAVEHPTGPATPGGAKPKGERLAAGLGVILAQLKAAQAADVAAATGLGGMTAAARRDATARRLGITTPELKLLRLALQGTVPADRNRAASLIRLIAGGDQLPAPAAPGRFGRPVRPTGSPPAAPRGRRPAGPPARKNDLPAYVTTWGNVVHLYWDCLNTRGFRHVTELDPDVYQVSPRDPCCRGRRVCGTCKEANSRTADRLALELFRFHGKPFDEAEWAKGGWYRPRPTGVPIKRR